MALENYRIIEYPEKTEVDTSDYMLVDSESNGTNKYQVKRIITEAEAKVTAAVAAEADAREAADEALQDDIDTRATSVELAAETAAREAADDALKADLTSEQTARQNADNALGEDITALSEDVETNYAKIDGYYDSLGVGMADQLASNKYTEDNEPYVYRTSGGTADIGDREYDEIVGGTVVWNQRVSISRLITNTENGVTQTNNQDGSITINGTCTGRGSLTVENLAKVAGDLLPNHVYYLRAFPSNGITGSAYAGVAGLNIDNGSGGLFKMTYEFTSTQLRIDIYEGDIFDNATVYPQYIDLTAMFGASVADAIYALEQAEAGAGVAWFKKLFPKDYYPYNAGELISVSALQSHDMVGFNQWDEEWELGIYDIATGAKVANTTNIRNKNLIPVLPNTRYCWNNSVSNVVRWVFFDADKNRLSSRSNTATSPYEFTTPENAHYMAFYYGATTYDGTLCINFSWSGWRNGEYEAYDKKSYPLDSSLTLRGIPNVDSARNLYYDGDIYASDGTVTRKYKKIVIDGNSNISAGASGMPFITLLSDKKMMISANDKPNAISDKLTGVIQASTWDKEFTFAFVTQSNYMYFKLSDSITTIEDAKTWLTSNPITVVYELATPTTETAQPYASPQIVDDFGTEEYVSTADVRIPVGHNTKYMANLRDKLVHLPDLADSDGAYLIQQTGHTMELVKFRIPKAPTTDGTYTLKATVSGGTPTYFWEVVQ